MTKQLKFILIICIICFCIGALATVVGALFKLQHWPGASLALTLGTILNVLALILLVYFLVAIFRRKSMN